MEVEENIWYARILSCHVWRTDGRTGGSHRFMRYSTRWPLNNMIVYHRCRENQALESLVVSTLLYGAESWPLSVTQMKTLEAAHHHHKFQRMLGTTW